jgi:hypothetical protein
MGFNSFKRLNRVKRETFDQMIEDQLPMMLMYYRKCHPFYTLERVLV